MLKNFTNNKIIIAKSPKYDQKHLKVLNHVEICCIQANLDFQFIIGVKILLKFNDEMLWNSYELEIWISI
jgi:hypothetical protein